jgi:hypothetical protein
VRVESTCQRQRVIERRIIVDADRDIHQQILDHRARLVGGMPGMSNKSLSRLAADMDQSKPHRFQPTFGPSAAEVFNRRHWNVAALLRCKERQAGAGNGGGRSTRRSLLDSLHLPAPPGLLQGGAGTCIDA